MGGSFRRWGSLVAFGLISTLPLPLSAADPCKLLTVQEISQVLGVTLSPDPAGTTGCFWKGAAQRVSIVLRDAKAWPRIIATGPGITKTDVSGLGDAASISGLDPSTHPGQENVLTLSVKQGGNVIVLTVYGVKGTDRQRSMEESLARLALRRL
jgi:hypothetical protein